MPVYPNQDLVAQPGEMESWNLPVNRRASFHDLHRIIRYGFSVRAPDVLKLTSCIDARIAELGSVQQMCSSNFFSAMVVLRGEQLVYEQYAPDFAPHQAHTIMSITKTMTHLIMGRCVEDGLIDLNAKVCDYLPEIGSGYADAIIQNVLDMNIVNDYSEDYSDLHTTALLHNASMGWRLPAANVRLTSNRDFLCTIGSNDLLNRSGEVNYKSASTDVLAWIAERVSGQALRDHLIRIVEAAGIEHTFYMSTDHTAVPNTNGGACLSPRDLARLGLIFARRGRGINGKLVGSHTFMDAARRCTGPTYPPPDNHIHYGNQLKTNGRWVGHGGWGGQLLMVDPETTTVVVFFSVLENQSASDDNHSRAIVQMAEEVIGC